MANVSFFIEITGDIDTLALWELIEKYRVNLTSLDGKTWVYGELALHNLGAVIERCSLFGRLKVEVGGGGSDEPKETTQGET